MIGLQLNSLSFIAQTPALKPAVALRIVAKSAVCSAGLWAFGSMTGVPYDYFA
jgi:hypothetical protein